MHAIHCLPQPREHQALEFHQHTCHPTYILLRQPGQWGVCVSPDDEEVDDDFHKPDVLDKPSQIRHGELTLTRRALVNGGFLIVVVSALLALFVGSPIISYYRSARLGHLGVYGIGGTNASGQVPVIPGNYGLIDRDTPESAYYKTSWYDGKTEMTLVFSDEFNTPGRTFWPGDDPYWEAVNLCAIQTANGSLVITLEQKEMNGLNYTGGMMSTWNKFCFTGGYVEANVSLPGLNNVVGLWPAIWSVGNLGRAGYGASLDGLWPYTYDSCDVGTVANQSVNGQPVAATTTGPSKYGGVLSYLSGQQYKPGFDNAYMTWISNNQASWTLNVAGMEADPRVNISQRPVPQEPMYLIMNLGMSYSFTQVDLANIPFPVHLRVDYIRVYQPSDSINVGCDPVDFPTAAYINKYAEAYWNPNMTTWVGEYGQA
ncbi:hypothetical protein EVJ58_g8808 [Rhodofomes roseus]|uniref:GH16 domain-containing protein n=1 Tax=Rhodofomes roseus TaxID=34475 RepID=A0A4Y9XWT9_9APHY|nr:hypothetical protein EVJ58_g8808 [Rhodofomes roseus]